MSQLTRAERIWTVVLTLFLMFPAWFVFGQRPGEVTRGPAEPEQIVIDVPIPITESQRIDSWEELSAMLTVIGMVVALVQFLVMRIWFRPEIKKEFKSHQAWVVETFISKAEFQLHLKDDELAAMKQRLEQLEQEAQ